MPTTEHTINDALASALRITRHVWRESDVVSSEQSRMVKGSSEQPDILVLEPCTTPVAIEVEVLPAVNVENEAFSRLGGQLRATGRTILSSIAVRIPQRIRSMQGRTLSEGLRAASDLEFALFTGSSSASFSRWPQAGWIVGGIPELSSLVQSASIPPDVIDEAVDVLVKGVSEAAGILDEMGASHPGSLRAIAKELCQEDCGQTRRMATTILANAFMFHELLAGGNGDLANVLSLEQLLGSPIGLSKSSVLTEWRKILKVNYWPIFDIARRIFEAIPSQESGHIVEYLMSTALRLLQNRLMRSHDVTGAIFQRLITDRKFLAAYYTTPASAALLSGLVFDSDAPPSGGSWSDLDKITDLRIADFACGTGTLLSTSYRRIGQLHEMAGGNSEAIHASMMAGALTGCDVLPAAAHLTASMLAGAHPATKYDRSSIFTVAYGQQEDGRIALGSLDLLDPQGKLDILSVTAKAIEGIGEIEKDTWLALPHSSFDVVTMNPPFTRATNHEGPRSTIPNPMFAAFGSSDRVQKLMSEATRRLARGTCASGNAGEASYFLALADRKLKPGGVLALVMPLSLMVGESWDECRKLLVESYQDLIAVSIVGTGDDDISFSSDTGMAECLVIGKKSSSGSSRCTFVVLYERPDYPLIGASIANEIRRLKTDTSIRGVDDGVVGGTTIRIGDDAVGYVMTSPVHSTDQWSLSRIMDGYLAQTAFQLAVEKRVWLPTMNRNEVLPISITTIESIGRVGPVHRDINGVNSDGNWRGPFEITSTKAGGIPTYPALWAHDAKRERTMSFEADSEASPRLGKNSADHDRISKKVADIWGTASHCHINCDFRFNSQSTGMQFSPRKSLGGRAWLSVKLPSTDLEKVLTLWSNTSLGLLLRWWHSNRQQSGRGNLGRLSVEKLPVIDVSSLTTQQVQAAVQTFDMFCNQPLKPVHEIDIDPVRRELDERFASKVLGYPESMVTDEGPLDVLT